MIEEIWQGLRIAGTGPLQRRIDFKHPLDLYGDFEPPNRPGLVAICTHQPPDVRPLRAVTLEHGQRNDGRWTLRLALAVPGLLPVFAALCNDIVDFTRSGVSEVQLAAAVIGRIDRWRHLLEQDTSGLGKNALRGLIGELSILETTLDALTPTEAIASWTGPLGTPQDFLLPSGHRIEVKAARPDARTIQIHGLAQLDPGVGTLELAIVRIEDTGRNAPGALTAPMLIERIASRISADPEALGAFQTSLAFAGWQEHPRHGEVVVRIISTQWHQVGADFPKLTSGTVPAGVEDADYTITLPEMASPTVSENS